MRLSIIAAMDNANGLGFNNGLPWRGQVPSDMKRFKELTTGHTIIMGRKTFESFGGRLLPNRRHIVITRNKDFSFDGVEVCASPEQALELSKSGNDEEVFVIGGGEIYELLLPYVDRMYLTMINRCFEVDTHFPFFYTEEWVATEDMPPFQNEKDLYQMKFITFDRQK